MAKVNLTDLTSLANDTSATNQININFQTLEDYINDNVLSRDTGVETNTMQNELDMNSNNITNGGTAAFTDLTIAGTSILAQVNAAAASAAAALTSENNAATSETNAANSAAAAAASAASVNISLDANNTWTAAQQVATFTNATTTGATTLDFGEYQLFLLTLTGNVTLSNPTTEIAGTSGNIVFIQDATGSRTVSLGSEFLTAGGTGITLSTGANAIDLVPYIVTASGQILLGQPQLAFA